MITFIHVRKSAGTNVKKFFIENDIPFKVKSEGFYYDDNEYQQNEIKNFVGIIRNPYERCISSWQYCYTTRNRSLYDCFMNPPKEDEFSGFRPDGSMRKNGHDFRHFTMTQTDFLYSRDRKVKADIIIPIDKLSLELYKLCYGFGYKITKHLLPKYDQPYDKKLLISVLDQKTKDMIYEYYKEDFINFDFNK